MHPPDLHSPTQPAASPLAISPDAAHALAVRELGPVSVLIVGHEPARRDALRAALAGAGISCAVAGTAAAAVKRLENFPGAFDVVLVEAELPDGAGLDLAATVAGHGAGLVLMAARPSIDQAVAAMRAGACDLIGHDAPAGAVLERLVTAAVRARDGRRQRGRIVKLKRMCRRLDSARREVARQVDTLCSDLVVAYQELADHMNQVTTATEFKGLIKGELDIESLLRTTLEFMLSRSGPTNAAIFLPTTSGDYSLGAYVNYDCPKDTVDILLDQLANSVAPRFENTEGLVCLSDPAVMDQYIGDDAQWLDGSTVCAMACRHRDETLAVLMLFRDKRNHYGTTLLEQVRTIGDLFAAQLARVIHIHHRHLPKDKWGMLGDPEHGADGYDDLAA